MPNPEKILNEDYRSLGKPLIQDEAGQRLDAYLALKFRFLSRNQWIQTIKKGEVLVSGVPKVKPAFRLEEGDTIAYFCPEDEEPEVENNLEIVWQDDDILAVYKPPNLPMHEGGVYRMKTFHRFVQESFGNEVSAVHRLDRETSGIVLCARTTAMRHSLAEYFAAGQMQKTYVAIVKGNPEETFSCDAPLGNVHHPKLRTCHWVVPGGSPSLTSFKTLKSSNGYSIIEAQPKTGRTHQIRIHAAFKGHPLVGDKRYQEDRGLFAEYMDHGFTDNIKKYCLYDRLCLHAQKLVFKHPKTQKNIEVATDFPKDMMQIWNEIS